MGWGCTVVRVKMRVQKRGGARGRRESIGRLLGLIWERHLIPCACSQRGGGALSPPDISLTAGVPSSHNVVARAPKVVTQERPWLCSRF